MPKRKGIVYQEKDAHFILSLVAMQRGLSESKWWMKWLSYNNKILAKALEYE